MSQRATRAQNIQFTFSNVLFDRRKKDAHSCLGGDDCKRILVTKNGKSCFVGVKRPVNYSGFEKKSCTGNILKNYSRNLNLWTQVGSLES